MNKKIYLNKSYTLILLKFFVSTNAFAGWFPAKIMERMDKADLSKSCCLYSESFGNEEDVRNVPFQGLPFEEFSVKSMGQASYISAQTRVDFTKFAYSVNKSGFQIADKEIYNRLINDGWKLVPFNTKTGSAANQEESLGGVIGFRGKDVIIATRGTQTVADLKTDVRVENNPISRAFNWAKDTIKNAAPVKAVFSKIFPSWYKSPTQEDRDDMRTANYFPDVQGRAAAGFHQSYLSSWDQIKQEIIKYAKSQGLKPSDLNYDCVGHSLGGAKAQLNSLGLLTDRDLQVGINKLENSYILSASQLGMSFHAPAKYSEPKNTGNVDVTVFESPRVFSKDMAKGATRIIGEEKIIRIENKGYGLDQDPVINLAPKLLGYEHIGTTIALNGGGHFIGRHFMRNIEKEAVIALETWHRNFQEQSVR